MNADIRAQPSATYALVVGVEQYAAGENWNLNGPARDACRFVNWLISRGVPADNIALYLSPLEKNQVALAAPLSYHPATREQIYSALTRDFSRKQGDLLFFFWGGHGVITAEHSRRLFYADATKQDLLNLDLAELLTMLHSETYSGLRQQVGIIDTCANYIERWCTAQMLPSETFARTLPEKSIQQFFFFAGKAGDVVKNLDAEETGLFSREVLAYLTSQAVDHWPPDLTELVAYLQTRFSQLCAQGLTSQTPNYSWFKDWAGNESTLMGFGTTLTVNRVQPRRLTLQEMDELVTAVAACPMIANPNRREIVLGQLRSEIAGAIPRDATLRMDVFNIVNTCLNYYGGLLDLRHRIYLFEQTSVQMQQLDGVIQKLGLAADA
jgi:hypothetical protein